MIVGPFILFQKSGRLIMSYKKHNGKQISISSINFRCAWLSVVLESNIITISEKTVGLNDKTDSNKNEQAVISDRRLTNPEPIPGPCQKHFISSSTRCGTTNALFDSLKG